MVAAGSGACYGHAALFCTDYFCIVRRAGLAARRQPVATVPSWQRGKRTCVNAAVGVRSTQLPPLRSACDGLDFHSDCGCWTRCFTVRRSATFDWKTDIFKPRLKRPTTRSVFNRVCRCTDSYEC